MRLSLPRWLSVSAVVMFVLGLGLIGSGIWLEGRHWWDEHPFTTNVLSSFAGALVGIPISIVVVTAILDRAREHRDFDYLRTGTFAAIDRLVGAAERMTWKDRVAVAPLSLDECVRLATARYDRDPFGLAPESTSRLLAHCPSELDWADAAREFDDAWDDLLRFERAAQQASVEFPSREIRKFWERLPYVANHPDFRAAEIQFGGGDDADSRLGRVEVGALAAVAARRLRTRARVVLSVPPP